MKLDIHLKAIFWDYDGTLVDSRKKNLNVSRQIIQKVTGRAYQQFPALRSATSYDSTLRQYANWRDFYKSEFHLSEEETDHAGSMWTEYHLKDKTTTPVFSGIKEVIRSLKFIPNGIISQGSAKSISKILESHNLLEYFQLIIGYEEVDLRKQKPEPDGLLQAVNQLAIDDGGYIFYIGDQEADVTCAHNANNIFKDKNRNLQILTIGAFYIQGADGNNWQVKPDYSAFTALEILDIVQNFK